MTLAYPGAVTEFAYSGLLPLGADETDYRLVTAEGVSTFEAGGQRYAYRHGLLADAVPWLPDA